MGKGGISITKGQKFFQFICVPVLFFITIYLILYLLEHFSIVEIPSIALVASATALGTSIVHWLELVYPPKPKSEKRKKTIKEYVREYVIHGTPFQKFMTMIYSLSILIVIIVVTLTITGQL